ncbi:hypothetical protein ALC152_01420 [Arcobacter sp. 15-2]|uniref:AAA family ATPase n=1 Tax=Arcobacter sp. 15-2 TaxID=3374109 RepID=UPI00399D3998
MEAFNNIENELSGNKKTLSVPKNDTNKDIKKVDSIIAENDSNINGFNQAIEPLKPKINRQKGMNRLVKLSDFIEVINPNEWRIKGIIPKEGLVEGYGSSGSYKSFIFLDMGFCVASGISWQGFEVMQGAVLYIAGEAPQGVKKRLKGLSIHYDIKELDFAILPMPTNLMDENEIILLSNEIKELYPNGMAMIIFDTLHRNSTGSNENSAEDWGIILGMIDKYIRPIVENIIWIHHSGTQEQGRSRGTNSRYASADVSIRIEKSETLIAKVINDKQKESEEFSNMHFDMKIQDIGILDEDGKNITTLVPIINNDTVGTSLNNKSILSLEHNNLLGSLRLSIKTNGLSIPEELKNRESISDGKCINVKDWRDEAFKVLTSSGDIDEKKQLEAKRKKFTRYKKELINKGKIIEYDNLVLIIDDCIYRHRTDGQDRTGQNRTMSTMSIHS